MSYCNIEKAKEMASKMWQFQDSLADYENLCDVLDKCKEDNGHSAYWVDSEFGSYVACSHCDWASLYRSNFCHHCGYEMINVSGWKQ